MKALILSFSANQVNEESFIPNKIGLTSACMLFIAVGVVGYILNLMGQIQAKKLLQK